MDKRKGCLRCGQVKQTSDFRRNKKNKDGHRYTCKICEREMEKQRRTANPKKTREQWKKYRVAYRDTASATKKKWEETHRELRKIIRKKAALKYMNTPRGKLHIRIAVGIRNSIRRGSKAGRHWETLVGYTVDQLKKHIEKQFQEGMTWERFMKGDIHIDHIIPVSAFNFEKPEDLDFKRCWALKNLRPLWAKENIIKGGRIDKPFQPSLAMAILGV